MRSQKTRFSSTHKVGVHSQGVSPLPYGGSDRIVFLRSLPLSSLHALLVVACTMAFFVSLASGHSDEGIFGKRSLSGSLSMVRPADRMQVAATITPHVRRNSGATFRSAVLQLVSGESHAKAPTSLACRSGAEVDAITGRDPLDRVVAEEIEINRCLVLLPGPSARQLTRFKSGSAQVPPANFPQLC